ncbi:MAG: squalene--hopene cyclase [Pseudomonadota bacterium]
MTQGQASKLVGIVCGLKSEAAAVEKAIAGADLSRDSFLIGVSGADASRAEDIAEGFVEQGAIALLSVGVSGGLDPALMPGDLVVAETVLRTGASDEATGVRLDNPKSDNLNTLAPDIPRSLIYGSDIIIQSAEEKARLFRETQAVAVDMESHAVAHSAMVHGIPFLAIRAIADPAERALPKAALGAIAADGSTRIAHTLLQITKAPGDFPALLKLGSDSEKANARLRSDLGGLLRGLLFCLDL